MSKKAWYEVLNVVPNATEKEVIKSYRALAKQYHPDIVGPESEDKMKEINDAKDEYLIASNIKHSDSSYQGFGITKEDIRNWKQEEIDRKNKQVQDKLFERNFMQNLFVIVDNPDVSIWDFTDIYANVGNCFYSITSGDIFREVNERSDRYSYGYSCSPAQNYVTDMQPLIFFAKNVNIADTITSQEATSILEKSIKQEPKFYLDRLYVGNCYLHNMTDKINLNNIYYKIAQHLYNVESGQYYYFSKGQGDKVVPLVNAMENPSMSILSTEELLALASKIDLSKINTEEEWHFLENLYLGIKRWDRDSPIVILEHSGDYMRDISSSSAFYNGVNDQLIDNIIREYEIFPLTFLLDDDEIKRLITTREVLDILNQQRDNIPKFFTNKLFMGDYMECGSGSWRYDALYYEIGNKFYDLARGKFVNYDNMCYFGNYGSIPSANGRAIPFINALGSDYKMAMTAEEALETYDNRDKVKLQKIYTK